MLEITSPASAEVLATVPETGAAGVRVLAAASAGVQPIWSIIPATARAGYLRRAAQAILDDVDSIAALMARETGSPHNEALLAEILPAVDGLHALADDGPSHLAEKRLGQLPLLRAGRRTVLVRAPHGIVGIVGSRAAPWSSPAQDIGASLLAGNGVVFVAGAPLLAQRLLQAFERAGVPGGLIGLAYGPEAKEALLAGDACDAVVPEAPAGPKGTMLVLDGAPLPRTVSGALWAAFARGGRGQSAVGRIVALQRVADELSARIAEGARQLRVGDPVHPETEVGPLRSVAERDEVAAIVDEAVAAGATRLCGGVQTVPGLPGAYYAPAVLRHVPPDARVLRERVNGPVLAVVEAATRDEAIELASSQRTSAMSVWTGDREVGERIAASLPAELSWVNEHGVHSPGAEVRLAPHVDVRTLASQPTRLRSARWLPYDPALVAASTAVSRVKHGREGARLGVVRSAARPLARTAGRLVREWLE